MMAGMKQQSGPPSSDAGDLSAREIPLSREDAAAMTVNERLSVAGLMDEFDAAALRRDTEVMREILFLVHLSEPNVNAVVRSVLRRGYH
jgi:hypothetical protein